MMLLIDSGNSRLKAGWLRPGQTRREPQTVIFDSLDPVALAQWLQSLPEPPRAAIGVNVAGAKRAADIETALQAHHCAMQWKLAEPRTLGLVNRYAQPGQLGPDRWASLLGVRARLPRPHAPFVVACFGTATTIDAVSPEGVFEGGMILPGPALMRASLANGTANLPLAHGEAAPFPTDTHQAIRTGVAAAQAGAVLRHWLASRGRFGQAPLLYVAGGGWPDAEQETTRLLRQAGVGITPDYLDSPVLDGLAAWARAS